MKRLLVSLLLVVSACGGSKDFSTGSISPGVEPATETTTEAPVDTDVDAVVDAIVVAHGEDGGFDAVIWCFERGYSGDQLFAGALDGRLAADGVINAADGGTETPSGPPLGLIVLPAADVQSLGISAVPAVYRGAVNMSAMFDTMTLQEYKRKFADAELSALLLLIVGAARTGYSGRQIIELVIAGGSFDGLSLDKTFTRPDGTVVEKLRTCGYLRDLTGEVVVPEFEAPLVENSSGCTSAVNDLADKEKAAGEDGTEADVQTDEPFPWTFEGTARSHSSARLDFGARGSLEYDNERPFTITLNPDGTVDATFHAGSVTTAAVHCETNPPTGELSGHSVDATSLQLAGTHGDGTFRITDPSGGLDIRGTYTPSQVQADWETSVSVVACGDYPNAGDLHLSGTSSLVLGRTSPPAP